MLDVVKQKAAGEEIEPREEDGPEDADDLMAALEASLDGGGR